MIKLNLNTQHLLPLDGKRFELIVKKLADSLNYGTDPSPFFGTGMDYAQSRLYVPGDPVKSIDWRVTARTKRYHVKEYEAPKRMPVWVLFDTSASMTLSSMPVSKYAQGLRILTAIGIAAQQRMSPVGILGLGEREVLVQPTLARSMLMQQAHQLRQYRMSEKTHFLHKIKHWLPSLIQRTMVIVISDFHDAEAIEGIKHIACRHDLLVLHMIDPIEKGEKGHAVFRVREAESGRCFTALSQTPWLKSQEIQHALHQMRADYLPIDISQPFTMPLRHFLAKRNALSREIR